MCSLTFRNIDGNVEYDSLDIRERDEQEKYFDQEDDDSTRNSSKSSSAGDLTFLTPGQFKNMKKLSDKMSPLALNDDLAKKTPEEDNNITPEHIQTSQTSETTNGAMNLTESDSKDSSEHKNSGASS